VPGHPVLRTAMPELQKGLGVSVPGNIAMKAQQWQEWFMHSTKYGTPKRKALSIAEPAAAVALAVGAMVGAVVLADRLLSSPSQKQRPGKRVAERIRRYLEV
jgi:hypothetical protein